MDVVSRAITRTGAAVVSLVHPDSPAAEAGLRVGDRIETVNGRPILDIIDWDFYTSTERVEVGFVRDDVHRTATLVKDTYEPTGIEFDDALFDGIRRCANKCDFCFVTQNPRGLRKPIYIKDDDFRLSFLYGGFITLTNLTERNWARIAEQRLSPLYVSVHSTDDAIRRFLLRRPQAKPILGELRRLADLKVKIHTQLVLWPGVNDGEDLDRSLTNLAALWPAVQSIGIVPVGLTKYQRHEIRPHTDEELRAIVERLRPWQRRFRREFGRTFAYLSDEFYVRTGLPIPGAAHYDGYLQYENGIGMVRDFLETWAATRRRFRARPRPLRPGTIVTSALGEPTLRHLCDDLRADTGHAPELVRVRNEFWGETVNCAGLLAARDVVAQLKGRRLGEVVVVPRRMFDPALAFTIDGWTPEQFDAALPAELAIAETPADILRALAAP